MGEVSVGDPRQNVAVPHLDARADPAQAQDQELQVSLPIEVDLLNG